MQETLIQKAQRMGIKPMNAPAPSVATGGESLVDKAARLNIKPANAPAAPSVIGNAVKTAGEAASSYLPGLKNTYAEAAGIDPVTGEWGLPAFLKAAGSGKSTAADIGPDSKPIGEFAATGRNVLTGALRATGSILGTIFAPISQAVSSLADASTNNPDVQKFATESGAKLADAGKIITDWQQAHPEEAQNLDAALTVALTAAGGGELNKPVSQVLRETGHTIAAPVKEALNIIDDVHQLVKNKMATIEQPLPPIDRATALDNYTRGIRPSTSGKGTAPQIAAYQDKVLSAGNSIIDNKPNLSFTDADGNVIKGDSPKTPEQFSQAIAQTKRGIYKEYNALAEASGQKGGIVNLQQVASELDPIINDKSLAIAKPEAVDYAIKLKDRLTYDSVTGEDGKVVKTARTPLDSESVQNLIEHYNNSLQAFYKNPTYDTAAKAAIDALLANKTRGLLDAVIEKSEGPGYQALKNKYGALKAIESDVAKRAQVYARQNVKGLLDFSDIFTGGQVINGILNLNPQQIVTGLATRGIKEFLKWKNSPDRAIQGFFNEIEKAKAGGQTRPTPPTPAPQIDSGSNTTKSSSQDFTPKSQTVKYVMDYFDDPKLGLSVKNVGEQAVKDFMKTKPPYGLLKDMETFIDVTRKVKKVPYKNFVPDVVEQIEKTGIPLPKTQAGVARFFEDVLQAAEYTKQ